MSKKYEITTFDQIANVVTLSNYKNLAQAFANSLFYYLTFIEQVKIEHPETSEKENSEIAEFWFEWIDDNKNKILGVDISIKETGELIEIRKDGKNKGVKKGPWKGFEIKIIEQYWETKTDRELSEMLSRASYTVGWMRRKKGLIRLPIYTKGWKNKPSESLK